jgi:hypothetical protein
MSADQNVAVVMRVVEEFATAGNLAVASELFSSDYVSHGTGGGPDTSIAEAIENVRQLHMQFRDFSCVAEQVIAQGEFVAMRLRLRGTHADTGRAIDVTALAIDHVVQGRITEDWLILDEKAMLQQLSG